MIYATLDVDICDDTAFETLQDEHEGHPWRFIRLVTIAKRANHKGRVERVDGIPITAKELARTHDGRGPDQVVLWETFLELCIRLGLLSVDDDGCYRIENWRRWHRSSSDEPNAVRERVSRHRDKKRNETNGTCNETNGTCNETNATCNGCNDTEQSRAEQSKSRAEQEQSRARAEQSRKKTSSSSCDDEDSSDRYRSPEGDDDAGGAPPAPPPLDEGISPAAIEEAYRNACKAVSGGPMRGPDVSRLESLMTNAQEFGAGDSDVRDALSYAVGATRWAQQHGSAEVKSPRGYLVGCAQDILPRVVERNRDRRRAVDQGFSDPGPLIYRRGDP